MMAQTQAVATKTSKSKTTTKTPATRKPVRTHRIPVTGHSGPRTLTQAVADIKAATGEEHIKVEKPTWLKLMEQGIIVDLDIRYWRALTAISTEDLGLPEPADARERAVFDQLMTLGQKKLLPAELFNRIRSNDSSARKWLEECSHKTHWGRFIPVGMYARWKEANEEFKAKHLAIRDELDQAWDRIQQEMIDAYAVVARESHRRLAMLNPASLVRDGAPISEDAFVDAFMARIRSAIPTRQAVYHSFDYTVELAYIPLPSLLARDLAETERIQAQAQIERQSDQALLASLSEYGKSAKDATPGHNGDLMEQMRADVSAATLHNYKALTNEFVRDIQAQVVQSLLDKISNVLGSLKKNDKLVGKAAEQVRNAIATYRSMNLVDQPGIDKTIGKLSVQMDRPAPERNVSEISTLLTQIQVAAKDTLKMLGPAAA